MSKTMKDSGIPWIGEIPSHWDTCFIKQVMRNKSVKGYPGEQVLSLYRDYGVVPKDSRDDNHNVTSEDTSGYKLVDVGDFVINKINYATNGINTYFTVSSSTALIKSGVCPSII